MGLNVCLVKTAGFGFPAPLRGVSYPRAAVTKQAEIFRECWKNIINNEFESLPDRSCWVWLSGAVEGGGKAALGQLK